MKLEFEHRTYGYADSCPSNTESVKTTLTVWAEHGYSRNQMVQGNINLEALARDNNERQIRKALYGDLESEWRRMLESPSYDLQAPVDLRIRMEEFGALLRSKLEPGA